MPDVFGNILDDAGRSERGRLPDGVLDGEVVGGAVGLDDRLGNAHQRGAATSPASISFLNCFSPPETIRAASLVSRLFRNMALSCLAKNPPVPSMVLRKILPE